MTESQPAVTSEPMTVKERKTSNVEGILKNI